MLATSKELLRIAEATNKAIGAFNVSGLETIQAVLQAAEQLKEPVILEFAQGHEEAGVMDLDTIGPVMVKLAELSSVPVAVHLDHAVDLNYIKKALEMGFTSIMYDGSDLAMELNMANTILAVKMAKKYGASVEAEIGMMSGLTLNENKEIENREQDRSMFTDPKQAKSFVEKTKVDMLACSFGTVHGLYKSAPNLDVDLVKELHETIGVPIVMHGGSGVSIEDYKKVIKAGVRKINYYTYMAKAGGESVKANIASMDELYTHDIASMMIEAMKENVLETMKVFTNKA